MQGKELSPSVYTLMVVVFFLAASPLVITFATLVNQAWIFGCRGQGYAPDNMMAYCAQPRFADYEHAAYWRGLEPKALEALKRADVVVLGNSRVQMAFAQSRTLDYFRGRKLAVHLLGLGDGETSEFPRRLFTRYDIRPRAVIINVDYFFEPGLSHAAQEALHEGWKTDLSYALKRGLQTVHPKICAALPWLCGDARAIYRDRLTGMWSSENYDRVTPAPRSGPEYVERPKNTETLRARAADYISWLESRGACVILTGTPSARYDRGIARTLAESLGRPSVFPEVQGLEYYDTSHLTIESARRYMAAMYPMLDNAFRECGLF